MKTSEDRFYYLLKAYTDGTATAAEEQELFEWVAGSADGAAIKAHIEQLVSQHENDRFHEVDWDKIYRRIRADMVQEKRPHRVKRVVWLRVAAVMLLLILGGGALYLFSAQKGGESSPAITDKRPAGLKNDIKPGGTRAVLYAGNNSVMLTTTDTNFVLAGNQVRVSNGDVRVAKARPVEYSLIVPRGGTYSIVLADGTKVWLNADSKLVYPSVFKGHYRQVELQGEAYFEVATDADHPFIVKTRNQSVKVLGTAFNVQAYPDEKYVKTTLIEGQVAINSQKGRLQLRPGQQATMNREGILRLNPKVEVDQVIAWKNGYFRFDKADIHAIMRRLARWYDIKVIYSEGLPNQYFGAIISRDNNISKILQMLEATGDIHFRIEGNVVTVIP